MRTACLPWYDLVEVRGALDALWGRIADALADEGIDDIPTALDRDVPYEQQWISGTLLLGQACGYDVSISSAAHLQIVAAPRFELEGCAGATYRSFVVVRDDSRADAIEALRGARCVINTPTSHSGMNVLRALVAPLAENGRFFSQVDVSGAHERSLERLRDGLADVAAIDCITHGLLAHWRPDALVGTRVIHRTAPVTAPPFVTSARTPAPIVDALRRAIAVALPAPEIALVGADVVTTADFQPIVDVANGSARRGYHELSVPAPRR